MARNERWTWVLLGSGWISACSGSPATEDSPDGDAAGGTGSGGAAADGDDEGSGGTPDDGTASGGGGGAAGDTLLPPSVAPETSYCPFDDATDLTTFEGRPVVRVCPEGDARAGCDVTSLQAAIDQVPPGGRVEVVGDGGDYLQCGVIGVDQEGLEIAGVCGRPHFVDTVCQQKGTFLHLGTDLTLTNVEVSGAWVDADAGANGAAVRDQSLGGLRLRYVHFHDNQNGILGGKGLIEIDWSRFEANGSAEDPGYAHNTYFSADVDEVRVNYSLFLRARYEGNNFKSRAQKLVFRCSVSASLDGLDSRELDVSEGGELLVENSLIQQGPESSNSNLIGFATESEDPEYRHTVQRLVISGTDLINDKGAGTFVAYNAYDSTVRVTDTRYIGLGTPLTNTNAGVAAVDQAGNSTFATRADADLEPVSSDVTDLPHPRGCPEFEYF